MLGRSFTNGDEYRFAFNGMEKSPEISSGHNTTRFRELGTRLGRYPKDELYPMYSPYSSFGNNPINIIDTEGDLLRDKDGNLIVVTTGKGETKTLLVESGAYTDKSKTQAIMIKYTYKDVYILANDGTKIKAQVIESKEFVVSTQGQFISVDPQSERQLRSNLDPVNCHGVSCGENQLAIFNKDIDATFKKEGEFKTTSKDKSDIVVFSDGEGKTTHSAKKEGDIYSYSDGAKSIKKGNANDASGNGKYVNPKHKKEIIRESELFNDGGDRSKEGLRIFSEGTFRGRRGMEKHSTGKDKY